MTEPISILGLPGVKRDGTLLDGENYYVDALWMRFQRKRPRKMGGYQVIVKQFSGDGRGMWGMSEDGAVYLHVGAQSTLERVSIDALTGVPTGVIDRTPAGFTADDDNAWHFAELFDTVGTVNYLIAHAAPWAANLADDTDRPVYIGQHTGIGPLTAVASVGPAGNGVSGGCSVFYPYAFYYGDDGYLQWSVPLLPSDVVGAGSGETRIARDKVVHGAPLRAGPGNAPSGLFWTLSSLVRLTFVGGSTIFNFDVIADESSILSPRGVVELDGRFYWPGLDRFLTFNGVVQEIPNDMNSNWFFENLNYDLRGLIWGYKVPRFGEIWWCYPRGTATECTHAIVYKPATGEWYDTPLPNGGRSCGFFAQLYRYPFMLGVQDDDVTGKKTLWQHEKGVNQVDGSQSLTVQSYFETHPIFAPAGKLLSVPLIEPDFIQIGELTVTVIGRANARAADVESIQFPIVETPTSSEEQYVTTKEARRQLRFRFESNVLDGDYQAGDVRAHIIESDARIGGAV